MSDPHVANPCFGCGDTNPRGMHLRFERDEGRQRVVGNFQLGPEYQGATGFVHGGNHRHGTGRGDEQGQPFL